MVSFPTITHQLLLTCGKEQKVRGSQKVSSKNGFEMVPLLSQECFLVLWRQLCQPDSSSHDTGDVLNPLADTPSSATCSPWCRPQTLISVLSDSESAGLPQTEASLQALPPNQRAHFSASKCPGESHSGPHGPRYRGPTLSPPYNPKRCPLTSWR